MKRALKDVLYPEIEPHNIDYMKVSGGHEIYFEEAGNPNGKVALFVHGGPGGGTSPKQRRFFDPMAYRIIMFDQRGCGRSKPHASLEKNTTWDLVADMEQLRRHLGVKRWLLFGGSWGSALSLAYAETYPGTVSEIVLRGIFLVRRKELRWFYQEGASAVYPDAWQEYWCYIPAAERGDMIGAYYRRLTDRKRSVQIAAARVWSRWEKQTSHLIPDAEEVAKVEDDDYALAFARIECHYFMHGGFFAPESQLLDGVGRIRSKKVVIVQGRYDMVCPMMTAWELYQRWPKSKLRIVPEAGHSAFEPGIVAELIRATDEFRIIR